MAIPRLTLLATAAVAAGVLQTPLPADAAHTRVPALERALLLDYASTVAYQRATSPGVITYGVTGCTLTRRAGRCSAYMTALTGFGYGRAEYVMRARLRGGRVVGVTRGPDHWTPISKLGVYPPGDSYGEPLGRARRRGLQ